MTGVQQWLNELSPGDPVVIVDRYGDYLCLDVVERVNVNDNIITLEHEGSYDRNDRRWLGGRYSDETVKIEPLTDKHQKTAWIRIIKSSDLAFVPLGKLKQIVELLAQENSND